MQYFFPARGGTAGRSATVLSPQPSPETLPNIQLNQRPMRINQQRSCSRRVVATWPRSSGRSFVRARQSRSHTHQRRCARLDRAAKPHTVSFDGLCVEPPIRDSVVRRLCCNYHSQERPGAKSIFFCWSNFTHVWPAGHDSEFHTLAARMPVDNADRNPLSKSA